MVLPRLMVGEEGEVGGEGEAKVTMQFGHGLSSLRFHFGNLVRNVRTAFLVAASCRFWLE